MKLEDLNITELKAIAFDHVCSIEQSNLTINAIRAELNRRSVADTQIEENNNKPTEDVKNG